MCIDILIIENENFYGHLQRVHDVIETKYGLQLSHILSTYPICKKASVVLNQG